jgi:hypothetical protein
LGTLGKNESEKVKVTAKLLPSGKTYQISVPVNWTIERFISEFKRKMEKNDAGPIEATLKRTSTELNPEATFKAKEIVEGDTIILRETITGG